MEDNQQPMFFIEMLFWLASLSAVAQREWEEMMSGL